MGIKLQSNLTNADIDILPRLPEVRPAGRREMKLIALQAMLNQLVIRDDSVTKLECVIMAGVAGESRLRSQRQQHNGCTGKLQIHLHLYLLFPKNRASLPRRPRGRV